MSPSARPGASATSPRCRRIRPTPVPGPAGLVRRARPGEVRDLAGPSGRPNDPPPTRRRRVAGPRRRGRAVPRARRGSRGRGGGRLPRLERGHDRRSQTDHELFNLTLNRSLADLRLLINDGPGDGPALRRGRRAVVHDAVRPRLAHHRRSRRSRSGPRSRSRRSRSSPTYQATEVDDWRDAEPGKILHELRTGEMARAGELPHTPYYGSVDSTPLWLILLGATFDWTGDRALVDRLWPNALAALDWIDTLRRPRRRRLRRVRAALDARPRSTRAGRTPATRSATGPAARPTPPIALAEVQGYVFDAKRRMAGLATDPRRDRPRRPARRARPRRSAQRFEERVLGRGPALLRDGPRRREAPGRRDRLERRPVPLDRDRVAGRAPATSPTGCSGRRCSRGWGIRTYAAGPARLQPDRLPHRARLAARHVADRGRPEALRLRRRVEPARRPRVRGGPALRRRTACRSCSAASTATTAPTPVPYPVACSPQAWAAGASFLFLETMLGLRGARRPAASWSCSTRTCPTGSARSRSRTCGSAMRRSTCCSTAGAARRSAEVLRKVGDVVRHDPALSAARPSRPRDGHDRRAARERDRRGCGRAGSETARLDAEVLLALRHRRRPDGDPRPSRGAGRAGRRGAVRGRGRPAGGRRAGRLHPRDQGVLRARASRSTRGR